MFNIEKQKKIKTWFILFCVYTGLGTLNLVTFLTEDLSRSKQTTFHIDIVEEYTGAYTAFLLLPLLLWFFKRYPLLSGNLVKRIPLHLGISMAYGVSHTMLMYVTRQLFFHLLKWGEYDYGRMDYRFMMEYSKQLIAYCSTYAVFAYINSRGQHMEQAIKTEKLEKQLVEARLLSLKMQIQPHFLFNTLNMISSTMYENLDQADSMIANLSDLLRHAIQNPDQHEHSLREEKEITDAYVQIMLARFKDNLQVVWDIPENLMNIKMPRFFLQPIVENAIQYGMDASNRCRITIQCRKVNQRCQFRINDDGPGVPKEKTLQNSHGIGLSNITNRLDHLYGQDARFYLESQPGRGTTVVIEIPFRLSERIDL